MRMNATTEDENEAMYNTPVGEHCQSNKPQPTPLNLALAGSLLVSIGVAGTSGSVWPILIINGTTLLIIAMVRAIISAAS